MIDEKKDKDLEDLFRKKLEGAEMQPGDDLTGHFMNRLGRREFIRFNVSRFNIFYLASAVAAAATVSGLLFFSPVRQNEMVPVPLRDSIPTVELAEPVEITSSGVVSEPVKMSDKEATGRDESKEITVSSREGQVHSARSSNKVEASRPGNSNISITKPKDYDNISIRKSEMPAAAINASVSSGCVPLNVTFESISSGDYKTEWNFGDGGYSNESNVSYIYDLPGTYDVSLTVTDETGRKGVSTQKVEVWQRPKAIFEIPEADVSITDDNVIFSNLSSGATKYLWSFGDGTSSDSFEPTHKYNNYGKYDVTLVAVSENGCADTIIMTDAFTDSGMFLRFPNAFTPNTGGPTGGYYNQRSDMNNQVFHPVCSGVVDYELKIYTKQGLIVFETDDILEGWDGYYKGQMCSHGVYVWKVRGTYRNGSQVVMSGDVTLLRY